MSACFQKRFFRFNTVEKHSIDIVCLAMYSSCSDTEHFYTWGLRWHVWVQFVSALLPSHLTWIIALVTFFYNTSRSFIRSITTQTFYVILAEVLSSFCQLLFLTHWLSLARCYYNFFVLDLKYRSDLSSCFVQKQRFHEQSVTMDWQWLK